MTADNISESLASILENLSMAEPGDQTEENLIVLRDLLVDFASLGCNVTQEEVSIRISKGKELNIYSMYLTVICTSYRMLKLP